MMKNIEKKIKVARIIIIVAAVLLITFLFIKEFAVFGRLNFKADFKKFTPFVSILKPTERVKIGNFVYLEQEPVYFDVFMPRDFNQAVLQFEYRNDFQNLIEVGAKTGESNWELKPLENKILNELNWPKLETNGLILWQKQADYKSIEDFIFNLPPINEIGVYNYNLDYEFKIPGYQPKSEILQLDEVVQGSYQFYTYIKDEDLDWEIEMATDEYYDGAEDVLNLYYLQGQNLSAFKRVDNKIKAQMSDLPEGAYRLELITADYIKTNKIKTKQQYLSFINKVDTVKPCQLITESQDLNFTAYNNNGLQTVTIGSKELNIVNVWEQYKVSLDSKNQKIVLPKGEINVSGEGLFSFSPAQYFNPLPTKIASNKSLNLDKIKYVISDYGLPVEKDGLSQKSVAFDLAGKQIENGVLRFIISVPGLSEGNKGVVIKNLAISLKRQPIWQEGMIKNFLNYSIYLYDQFR